MKSEPKISDQASREGVGDPQVQSVWIWHLSLVTIVGTCNLGHGRLWRHKSLNSSHGHQTAALLDAIGRGAPHCNRWTERMRRSLNQAKGYHLIDYFPKRTSREHRICPISKRAAVPPPPVGLLAGEGSQSRCNGIGQTAEQRIPVSFAHQSCQP